MSSRFAIAAEAPDAANTATPTRSATSDGATKAVGVRLLGRERVVDLLAGRADRRVRLRGLGDREPLAAQRLDHGAVDGALGRLGKVDVVEHIGPGGRVLGVRALQNLGVTHSSSVPNPPGLTPSLPGPVINARSAWDRGPRWSRPRWIERRSTSPPS